MTTAEAIKTIRMTLGLEQDELGEILQITGSSICHYEKGLRRPRARIVRDILMLARKHKIKITAEDFLT